MYVDDLLITGSYNNQIGSIKASLHSEFAMTDLWLLRQFLGLEIEQYERGIMQGQPKYDSDLLIKFNMDDCKASKCPFLSGIKLGEFGNSSLVDCTLYMKLVSSLLYLTHTRPDLSYAVLPPKLYLLVFYQVSLVNQTKMICSAFRIAFGKCLLYYITCPYPVGEL